MKWTLFFWAVFIIGCAPALQYNKASSSDVRQEELIQKRMAAEIKKERAKRLSKVASSLNKSSIEYCKALNVDKKSCYFPVELVDDQTINAFADGNKVYIPVGMIRFAENDDELALVVGHELAHNTLSHASKKAGNSAIGSIFDLLVLATTGVDTAGAFGDMASHAYSQSFESEADYLGMYIIASSGYDVDKATLFWRRMAVEHPSAIAKRYDSTHPSTPERFAALSDTLDEIRIKQDKGFTLMPKMKGEDQRETTVAGVVPEKLESAGVTPKKTKSKLKEKEIIDGKYSYTVAKVASQAGCANENGLIPVVTMFKAVPGEEYYRALCKNIPPIEYICAYQQCTRTEQTLSEHK